MQNNKQSQPSSQKCASPTTTNNNLTKHVGYYYVDQIMRNEASDCIALHS